ncbi:hypothetical protein [Lysinibacter sp. HNR]|uniref:hypothetical protein n=1 Tax=Lysinibacter sp. HNR TaxID=3031408 RepID=UPI0024357242|nr:hypothetical protein [Lysinibacter sp. HNR]WGD38118.1 hypothetical protein FrondiHNR_04150 [Lysinibacter sp. HNR]
MTDAPVPSPVNPEHDKPGSTNYWHWSRLVIVWGATTVASALVSLLASPALQVEWFIVVLSGATLLSFGLQLGTAQRQGFIDRIALSVVGSLFIIAFFSVPIILVA